MGNTEALPIHPTTGLQALAYGRRGPIWPVLGGSEDGGGANGAGGGDGAQQDQNQNGGAGNGAGTGKKGEHEQLPDDHPLVKRLNDLKTQVADLKPKAKLVDDVTKAQETDAQKIANLQTQVDSLPKQVATELREHLVELHGIESEDAELFLTGDTPEVLKKQVKRLLDQSGGGPKRRNHVPREGAPQGKPQPDDTLAFVQRITDRGGQ